MDFLDEKILCELGQDGRISNTDLAQKVGLSASACLRRVQAMEKSGVIKGYKVIVDRDALGCGFIAYVAVGLARHLKEDQVGFEEAMARAPEVKECHNITGSIEYLLRVEVADLAAYKCFHTEVLGMVPQVNSITSYIVMESSKE